MNLHLLLIVLSQFVYMPVGWLKIDELVFPTLGGENKQLKIWTWSSNKLFKSKYYCLILIL